MCCALSSERCGERSNGTFNYIFPEVVKRQTSFVVKCSTANTLASAHICVNLPQCYLPSLPLARHRCFFWKQNIQNPLVRYSSFTPYRFLLNINCIERKRCATSLVSCCRPEHTAYSVNAVCISRTTNAVTLMQDSGNRSTFGFGSSAGLVEGLPTFRSNIYT